MGTKFSTNTLKTKASAASQRIKLRIGKKTNQINLAKREIAKLLEGNKIQSAKIKAEGLMREENYIKVMEWLSLMCELVKTRIHLIASSTTPPEDMMETYCTILYCSKRVDVPELMEIAGQLQIKYGEKWVERNANNRSGRVDNRIVENLSAQPPTHDRIIAKLQEVSLQFNKKKWEDPGDDDHKQSGMKVVNHSAPEVDQGMVDRCVGFLLEPAMADYTQVQKCAFLKEKGANDAEIAIAIQVAKRMAAAPAAVAPAQPYIRPQPGPQYPYQPPGGGGGQYPGLNGGGFGPPPSNGGGFGPPPSNPTYAPQYPAPSGPGFGPPPGFNTGPSPNNTPPAPQFPSAPNNVPAPASTSPPPKPSNEGMPDLPDVPAAQQTDDMDDLEARFAALKKGL